MAKNVTLLGASYSDVPSIILPQTGGGDAEFYADKANPWGANLEYVSHLYHEQFSLNDTDMKTWTPTGTSTVIRNGSVVTTFTADLANYDYVLLTKAIIDYAYGAAATNVSKPVKNVFSMGQMITKKPSSPTTTASENYNGNAVTSVTMMNSLFYYGSNGNYSAAYSANAGVYFNYVNLTLSSSTSYTPTVSVSSQQMRAATSGYMSADNVNAMDKANSIVKVSCDLYRTKKFSTWFSQLIHDCVDLFNNGLTLPTN